MSINYRAQTDGIIAGLDRKKSVMLHACCAPCSTACIEYLSPHFELTLFYYNPNIQPFSEYEKRGAELKRLAKLTGVPLIVPEYDAMSFIDCARGFEHEPEGGARCERCFKLRLNATAEAAKKAGADYFCTTLTVSPHKDAQMINETGREIGGRVGVPFLPSDFKKKDGYRRSIELSNEYSLYRQDHCGCEFARRYQKERQNER